MDTFNTRTTGSHSCKIGLEHVPPQGLEIESSYRATKNPPVEQLLSKRHLLAK